MYRTDIKTYLNGSEIHACNINGETLVKLADMAPVGYVSYDDTMRLASLDVIKHRVDDAFDAASDKQELTLSDGVTYFGQVQDGKPNGIGIKYDKSHRSEFPGTINDITTEGEFSDGELCGLYYQDGTYQYTISSDRGTYETHSLGNKKSHYKVLKTNYNAGHSYYYSVSTIDGMDQYQCTGTELRGNINNEYLYCIDLGNHEYTTYTTYLNGDTNIAAYEDLPKFVRFGSQPYSPSVIAENGRIFSIPYAQHKKMSTDRLYGTADTDKKVIDGSDDCDWFLTDDGRLYVRTHDGPGFVAGVCVAENVAMATEDNYLSSDGVLYEDTHDGTGYHIIDTDVKMYSGDAYMIYLKNDGSVWTYRSVPGPGGAWNDNVDRSKPVKRADNAKFVNCVDMKCMYIKNDGSLYGFGLSTSGELGYKEEYDFNMPYEQIFGKEHIKLGEGFVSCKARQICLALKDNGELYAWGDNKSGVIVKDGANNIFSPVKVADNVRDYINSADAIYIIKNDGTLWYKGKTSFAGYHATGEYFDEFTLCDHVYYPIK